ncbi:MAG: hypothetical protein IJR63_01525 [Synergistaceae bacterium]|nr:hypothetical protein [Synergistaceae bacterium]
MYSIPFIIVWACQPSPSFREQRMFDMSKIVVSNPCTRSRDSFTIQDELTSNLERLEDIARLDSDWNGYGAKPFTRTLIAEVRNIIQYLSEQPEIFPTGRESIQLEYHLPDESYLEFEVFEDKVVAMQVTGTDYDNAQFWEFASNDVAQICNITDRFLNAQ